MRIVVFAVAIEFLTGLLVAQPANAQGQNAWHFISYLTDDGHPICVAKSDMNPAAIIRMAQASGVEYITQDTRDPGTGQVVTVTILRAGPTGGIGIFTFYRGRARCQAAIEARQGELDKYR